MVVPTCSFQQMLEIPRFVYDKVRTYNVSQEIDRTEILLLFTKLVDWACGTYVIHPPSIDTAVKKERD